MAEKIFKVKPEEQVEEELNDIFEYILEKSEDFEIARNIARDIRVEMNGLCLNPERGSNLRARVRFETNLKYILKYSYTIIYEIIGDVVQVKTICHTSRDFLRISERFR